MKLFTDFLHQKVPESSRSIPGYYRTALRVSETVFAAFFLVSVFLLKLTVGQWEWMPILTLAATVFCLISMDKMSARVSFACFSVIICVL